MEVEYMENPIVLPWLELSSEITSMILQKLGTIDLLKNADKVIKLQNADTDNFWDSKDALEKIYRPVVDRSQGQLIDISIEYYGIKNMLNYVAQRSPQLKHLELICSYNVFGDELSASSFKLKNQIYGYEKYDGEAIATVENMPELHHLQLLGNKMTNEGLEVILNGCRHLESLDLRRSFNVHLGGDALNRSNN
ncbi:hypothetical protein H5410_040046 [Solanum commersonii]|uniref:Uncharacterized protein n=1 Tax=Solanum commersonii TaxID=4109 RepID=A0A9J5XQ89_SOLCO|nr:hypothetical protein H5410_040046 [Solanum commersonii]